MSLGIIIFGALGRMGKEIAEIALSDEAYHIQGAIEYKDHPSIGDDYGICLQKSSFNLTLTSSFTEINCENSVCIDFSAPNRLTQLPIIAEKKCPLIIGTTGLSDEMITYAQTFSSDIPILISPNMSLGVNLMFLLTEMITPHLKDDYDIEIVEAHHRFKKDSPSGTAKRLGEIVASALNCSYNSCIKDGRNEIASTERPKDEIGMHAIRGGDIVGDHTILFAGIGERIELRHMAHNRSTFARGACIAAKWLDKQKPGIYSMRDMLGL